MLILPGKLLDIDLNKILSKSVSQVVNSYPLKKKKIVNSYLNISTAHVILLNCINRNKFF